MGYYMGDFYRGDPGFWSGLWGLAKGAVGMIPGVGPIASKVLNVLPGGARTAVPRLPAAASATAAAASSVVSAAKGMIVKHPVLSAAGAAGAIGTMAGMGAEALMSPGAACPKGYHPCKSKKHGCKKGPCVRNRHMNVCNPRALRRAARRAHGFLRLSRHLVRYYSPKAHKGRAYIGRPRRKK